MRVFEQKPGLWVAVDECNAIIAQGENYNQANLRAEIKNKKKEDKIIKANFFKKFGLVRNSS